MSGKHWQVSVFFTLSSFVVICYLRQSYHLLKNTAMHNGWKGATRPGSPGAHRWGTLTVLSCYSRSSHNIMQYHKVCKLSLTESSVTSGIYLFVQLWTKQLEKLWTPKCVCVDCLLSLHTHTTGVSRSLSECFTSFVCFCPKRCECFGNHQDRRYEAVHFMPTLRWFCCQCEF